MQNEPWEILGLDAATASVRDVKRAYAQLIKLSRPDTDSEGFQRIHQAYQFALEWVRQREGESQAAAEVAGSSEVKAFDADGQPLPVLNPDGSVANPSRPPAVPLQLEEPALPEEFSRAAEGLRDALKSGNADALRAKFEAFQKLPQSSRELVKPWVAALEKIFEGNLTILGAQMSAQDLRLPLEADFADLPMAVVVAWAEGRDLTKLAEVSHMLLWGRPAIQSPASLLCQARVADLLAFLRPKIAEELLNSTYPHLAPNFREFLTNRVEPKISCGKLFSGLPEEEMHFWEDRLYRGEKTFDWNSMQAQLRVRALLARRSADWPGYAFLGQVVPPDILNSLVKSVVQNRHRNQIRSAEVGGGSRFSRHAWLALMVGFILIRIGLYLGSEKPQMHRAIKLQDNDVINRQYVLPNSAIDLLPISVTRNPKIDLSKRPAEFENSEFAAIYSAGTGPGGLPNADRLREMYPSMLLEIGNMQMRWQQHRVEEFRSEDVLHDGDASSPARFAFYYSVVVNDNLSENQRREALIRLADEYDPRLVIPILASISAPTSSLSHGARGVAEALSALYGSGLPLESQQVLAKVLESRKVSKESLRPTSEIKGR